MTKINYKLKSGFLKSIPPQDHLTQEDLNELAKKKRKQFLNAVKVLIAERVSRNPIKTRKNITETKLKEYIE